MNKCIWLMLLCTFLLVTYSIAEIMVIHKANGETQKIPVEEVDSITFEKSDIEYLWHEDITASTFWAGEGASKNNGHISNYGSAWHTGWAVDFGLEDHPVNIERDSDFIPTSDEFTGNQNPYYIALPYNDFSNIVYDGSGSLKTTDKMIGGEYGKKMSSQSACYWKNETSNESACKNRWVEIRRGDKLCYAQWEDAGPYYYEDTAYVFGTSKPLNTTDKPYAAIDLSPSCWLYLGKSMGEEGTNGSVDWRFIDEENVPEGPWKKHVTTSQTNWD